jgi:hypothetical protein
MSKACSIRAFNGCSCTNECQSAAVPIIKILDRPAKTVAAKRCASTFVGAFLISLYLTVAIGCGITLDNYFKRQALIEQENVHVVQR